MKACQKIEIAGKRGRGRGKKTWSQCIDEDLRALQLNVRDAQDRLVWRRGIWGNCLTHTSMEYSIEELSPWILNRR